ncbi:hypothetical protein GSI_04610 [Ganoderma sinense ZZ0214-1]|uniref:Uncharacterized protein n=1 Tax=Ganoderma sinense ZZ0214-1 TaxID=1077348 RepID=A0A2G8SHB3_9APHY|nr:hypothetical protein GSI_04610 [Ganoderma sinense ZZ0214-1]
MADDSLPTPAGRTNDTVHTPPMLVQTPQNRLNHTESRVVFGAPPPRVLTTAPKKPPAKRRKGRTPTARAATAVSNKNNGVGKAKTQPIRAKDSESSQSDVLTTQSLAAAEQQPVMPTSLVLGRAKRVRVATARALDQSPDMSAANKLKRRTDAISGDAGEGADQAEEVEHRVKRRNTGSK